MSQKLSIFFYHTKFFFSVAWRTKRDLIQVQGSIINLKHESLFQRCSEMLSVAEREENESYTYDAMSANQEPEILLAYL
jgi:hypothetical protein